MHAARLPPERPGEDGEAVVVKVLRPGIGSLVETDLKALRLAVRWLRPWKRLRRRVDLDRLAEEVTTTTRAELDLPAEGRNAERFALDFADDPRVRIPRVYWQRTAARTLTLENVAFLKIADHAALDAAGVSLPQLAKSLYQTYMEQIFVHHFVHADPHPGNLFVRPLDGTHPGGGRDFELVFVDFGMVAVIPPRLRTTLREYLYGLGTRDAERIVHAYQAAGMLLPGADLQRLVQVHEDLFQRLWGVPIGELRDTAMAQARYFLREYRDLLFELPFQVQVDLLFVSRAVGILAGLATSLDPDFDPWAETIPFAEELAAEELAPGLAAMAKQPRRAGPVRPAPAAASRRGAAARRARHARRAGPAHPRGAPHPGAPRAHRPPPGVDRRLGGPRPLRRPAARRRPLRPALAVAPRRRRRLLPLGPAAPRALRADRPPPLQAAGTNRARARSIRPRSALPAARRRAIAAPMVASTSAKIASGVSSASSRIR